MCRLIAIALAVWVAGLAAAVTLAAMYGPWWAIPMTVFGYFALSGIVVKATIKRLLMLPFRAKGAALRGATAAVHGVEVTDAGAERGPEEPADAVPALEAAEAEGEVLDGDVIDDEGEEGEGAAEQAGVRRREERMTYVWVDVTITPRANAQGVFRLWEATELMLVPAGTTIRRLQDVDTGVSVRRAEVWQDGAWGPDDPGKYEGERRVRLLFAVPPEMERRVRFQYYFETFGEVQLPRGIVAG
jgi:hypothetical protein